MMFSSWPIQHEGISAAIPSEPKTWQRNFKDDLKQAMEYLCEFKEKIDKLHPECARMIERMFQCPR